MTILQKIDHLMQSRKLNKNTLAHSIGFPKQNIYNWFNRGCDNMTLFSFKTLCDFFNVTMESMAYDDQDIQYRDEVPADTLTRDERELIKIYSELDDRGKDTVRSTARTQHELSVDDHKPEEAGDMASVSEDLRERGA